MITAITLLLPEGVQYAKQMVKLGKISAEDFEYIKNIDPSSNFKYVDYIAKQLLVGVDRDVINKNIKNIDAAINKNIIKGDFTTYTFADLIKAAAGTSKTDDRTTMKTGSGLVKDKDYKVVYKDNDKEVIMPLNHKASCYYGKESKWCVAMHNEEDHWNQYRNGAKITIYYIIGNNEKDAVSVYDDGTTYECFDSEDNSVTLESLLTKWKLKASLFVPFTNDLSDKVTDATLHTRINLELYKQKGTVLDLRHIDFSEVTNFEKLFSTSEFRDRKSSDRYRSLTYINFEGCNTSNVTNMRYMFYGCENLKEAPNFDTSNVTNMERMFSGCISLKEAPNFDTSNVTNMIETFQHCKSLTEAPEFNTSKVTSMEMMFYDCSSLTKAPEFNTSKVTDMRYMFGNCENLTKGDMSNWDVSKVEYRFDMFKNCPFPDDKKPKFKD